ncbi:MAG: hypothetical protein HY365_02370 [Candidatus Aenigmarchaeota archaeon]|nr:hypothetical protein [Candidatus Aenigmarchaeota archaeon]
MGRKQGFDGRKISSIVSVLVRNPDGIWVRQIARELKISPMTVSKYAAGILKPLLEETRLGAGQKTMLLVLRLKPVVLQQIRQGRDINEIMKTARTISKINSLNGEK